MTATCPTCHRSWDSTAAFCGACGERLDTGLVQPARPAPPRDDRRTGRPVLWSALGLAIVATVAVTVPVVTVDGPAPVSGEVGVPDTDRVPTPEAGRPPTRQAPTPTVQCQDAQGPVADCLRWIQHEGPATEVATEGIFGATMLDGTAVSYTGGTINAVDVTTGTSRWTRTFTDSLDMVAAHGDALLVGTDAHARLLSLATGEQRWSAPSAEQLYGDVLTDRLALTARPARRTGPTTLVARDPDDGRVRWTWVSPSAEPLLVSARDQLLVSQPQVQAVTALSPDTGEVRWQRSGTLRPGAAPEGVALLYQPLQSDPSSEPTSLHVTVVDEADGTLRWERTITEAVAFADGGHLLLVSSEEGLRAHDVRTGQLVWQVRTDERETPAHEAGWGTHRERASALATVTTGGILRGRDLRDGHVLWRRPATAGGESRATVDGNVLQVRNGPATQLRDVRTGALVMTYRADGWLLDIDLEAGVFLAPRSGHLLRLAMPGDRTGQ